MAYQKKTAEQRKEEITNAMNEVARQVPLVFQSDHFRKYLDFASSFHTYSVNNQILIMSQKPDASLVTGYRSWQDKGRYVNKGEKGIRILAPSSYRKKKTVPKLDADGKPVIGKDGKTELEKKDVTVLTFTLVSVFDVSQTSGEPIPEIAEELKGNSEEARILLQAVEAACRQPIEYHTKSEDVLLARGAHGYYNSKSGQIVVDRDARMDQKAKTLIHEWAHQRLHSQPDGKRSDLKEIEAEATAYVCSKHFGLDTSDYSFEYIASYANGKDEKELRSILDGIKQNTKEMIDSIADAYETVQINKNARLTENTEQQTVMERRESYMPMDLDVLLTEGEAIAEFTTTDSPAFNTGAVHYRMIVSSEMPLDHQDLAACLEDTLHRLLDAHAEPSDIEAIMGAFPSGGIEDAGNGITELDHGYAIPGQLMSVGLMEQPLPSLSMAIKKAEMLTATTTAERKEKQHGHRIYEEAGL